MIKRLIDAANRLADVAGDSVEYSDWPALQEAIKEVHTAAEEARNVGGENNLPLWESIVRFLGRVNDCLSPRISCDDDDELTIITLTWQQDHVALLMVISNDGDADYGMIQTAGEQFSKNVKQFKIADGIPEEIENFIRMNFTLNPTVQ